MKTQQSEGGRTRRSFYNVVVTLMTNIVIMVTAFAVQRVLVMSKGSDYNGINGLFTNIISMMSLADLGIGTAIIYHLYRPAAENDYSAIRALLQFYKKSYFVISGIVLLIGLLVFPFLPGLVGTVHIDDSLYLIFGLFLFDSVCSYFLGYKKSLLFAYQMNYVVDGLHFLFYMLQNGLQIFVLLKFNSFIAFLILKSLSKCIENIGISIYIHKQFPFMRGKGGFLLTETVKCDIIKKVKALLFHRLGKLCVQGSDSLVITGILGITQMSLYTNYQMVIGGITALLYKIFETLTSSVGNFLIDSNEAGRRELYKRIDFINYLVFGSATIVLNSALNSVVRIWIGEQFVFTKQVLFIFLFNFYLEGMRASVTTFKEAAGIFHEDRYVPVIEAMVNVITSILLASRIGIAGVFLGTIVSKAVVFLYSYPHFVCKPLFHMTWFEYVGKTMKHLLIVLLVMALSDYIAVYMIQQIVSPWGQLLVCSLIGIGCVLGVFIPIQWKNEEMQYVLSLVKKWI